MTGRSIIVTGGFGALGRVTAAAFAAQGDKVARVDFAPQPADAQPGMLDLGGVDLVPKIGMKWCQVSWNHPIY